MRIHEETNADEYSEHTREYVHDIRATTARATSSHITHLALETVPN